MKMLVPLDGSSLSQVVLPWVKLLSSKGEYEVELFRSYMPLAPVMMLPELTLAAPNLLNDEEVAANVNSYLEEQAKLLPDLKVETTCGLGPAADAILGRSRDAELTVIASHGESGITRWLLGSVTTKVVRASENPVLVVRADSEMERPAKLERIMVPLDGSPIAELALEQAAKLALKFGSKVVLYEGLTYRDESRLQEDWQAILARDYLRDMAKELKNVEFEVQVRQSSSGPGIVNFAKEKDIDLIIMGSHGRSGVSRWFLGSVTEGVVQRANCPVMVVYGR